MPTNQLSPWEGGDSRDVPTADSPATKHPRAAKVPLRPTFVEVPRGRSPARPLLRDSPAPPPAPLSAPPLPPPVTSAWSYNRNHSPILPSSVPHISSSRRLSHVLAGAAKWDKKPTEAKAPLSASPGGTTQKQQSRSDPLKASRMLDESNELLDWRPFLSVSTLQCREKPSRRQQGKVQVSRGRSFSATQEPDVLALTEGTVLFKSNARGHNGAISESN